MKHYYWLCSLVVLGLCVCTTSSAQSVIAAQYRINGGEPMELLLNADANLDLNEVEFSVEIDSSNFPIGFHTIEVRMRSSEGIWSHWQKHPGGVFVDGDKFLSGAEWFINDDPGEGNGTFIDTPDDGAWDERVEEFSPVLSDYGDLPEGVNRIYVRMRDQDNRWGSTRSAAFEVIDSVIISMGEWTLDPNSEPGTGTPLLAADGAFDSGVEELVSEGIDSSILPTGFHPRIYVRAQSSPNNRWSDEDGFASDAQFLINRVPEVEAFNPMDQFVAAELNSPVEFSVLPTDADGDFATTQFFVNGELQTTAESFTLIPTEASMVTVSAVITDGFDDSQVSVEWTVQVGGELPTPSPTMLAFTPTPVPPMATPTPTVTPLPSDDPTPTIVPPTVPPITEPVEVAKFIEPVRASSNEFGRAVDISGEIAVVGSPSFGDPDHGSVFIYEVINGSWQLTTELRSPNKLRDFSEVATSYGGTVAIEGTTVVVGDPQDRAVFIYEKIGGNWTLVKTLQASIEEGFGAQVAISGDTILVSQPQADNSQGTTVGVVHIYERMNNDWVLAQIIEPSNPTENETDGFTRFGYSVDIDGNQLIVGNPYKDVVGTYSGQAYIFEKTADTWVETAILNPIDAEDEKRFGESVSIKSGVALVGAYQNSEQGPDSGAAYFFSESNGIWSQQQKVIASDGSSSDYFGFSVSLLENTALIGAYGRNPTGDGSADAAGSAYLFRMVDGLWLETNVISASDPDNSAWFGWALAHTENYALIGAYKSTTDTMDAGAAYIFQLSTPVPEATVTPTVVPERTPTPTATPTPTGTPTVSPTPDVVEPTPTPELPTLIEPFVVYEFAGDTLAVNGWAEIPGGFAAEPAGTVSALSFVGNSIESSEDSLGLSITVDPGEVAFIFAAEPIVSDSPVLLRMTVRATGPDASLFLVGLKGNLATGEVDGSLTLDNTATSQAYVDEEGVLVVLFQPDGGDQITPIIQVAGSVAATGETTIRIDKLEVYEVDERFEQSALFLR